jgi:hydrogenase expression/formation protein HypC
MCVGVPGRVVQLVDEGALVDVRGRRRTVATLLVPEVRPGDYVLLSGGLIVERLSEEEARQRLELFDSLLEVLDETP